MPFFDDLSVAEIGLAPQLAAPAQTTAPVPPFSRMFDAALRRENIVGSIAESFTQPRMAPFDAGFDPFRNIAGYEDNTRDFLHANSDEDVLNIKARIDAERRRDELLDSGGFLGLLASGAATLLDPTVLLPVGGQAYAVSRTGRALEGMLRTGVASGAATAAQEAGLQATQITRPLSESAINVGAGTVLGGAMGGAIAAYGGAIPDAISRRVMRDSELYGQELDDISRGFQSAETPGAAGAAPTRGTTREQERLESALGAENLIAQMAPNIRPFVNSPSVSVPQFMQELSEIPVTLRKHAKGIPSPRAVETDIRMADGPLAQVLEEGDRLFVQYRTGREDRRLFDVTRITGRDVLRTPVGGKLDYHAFNEEIGKAMRRGDEHEIPEVAAAAKAYRSQVIEPWKQRAIEAGLLDEDVSTDTALSYFMRVYNTEKIIANREDFTGRIVGWLATEQKKKDIIRKEVTELLEEQRRLGEGNQARLAGIQTRLEELVGSWAGKTSRVAKSALRSRAEKEATRGPDAARLREADAPVAEAAERIAKASTDLDEKELRDISRQIIDRILGSPVGRLPYDIEVPEPKFGRQDDQGVRRGPLASRAFKIPDELIEDYLESDARMVSRLYSRTMAADVSLVERFGRVDMEDQFKDVMREYDALRQGKSEAEQKKLDRQMRADLRDLAAVRDRLRRTYALPDNQNGLANRAFSVVRDINYLRLLGGMTLASLGDLGRTVMVHGVTRVARDAVVPLLTNVHQLKLAASEAKLAGAATDMVMDTRSMAMADIMDDYGRWSKYERGLQALSNKFGLITLMAPWNSTLKQMTGVIGQTRTLQEVEKMAAGKSLSKANLTRLSWLGIGEEQAERIAEQFKAHGVKKDSVWWANTEAWTDPKAIDDFRAALAKEINTVIVTPGMEAPLAMVGAWGNTGKLLFQFKGYAMASTQRVLLTGLQRRDMATLNGVLMMTGLGGLSYYLRHLLDSNPNKKQLPDPATPDGLAQWLRESVDRAGITGWLFDAHNTLEKATGGAIGLQRLIGDAPSSRYSSRGVLGALAGPTGGALEDIGRVVSEGAQGELSEAGVRAGRRLFPLQNAIAGPRQLFDQAEEGLHRSLGTR